MDSTIESVLDITLLNNCYEDFSSKKAIFDKMYDYYKGKTEAMTNYKMVTERSNNKAKVNYMKKFIKEEVSYSVGNEITYISKSGDNDVIKAIDYYTAHWNEQHDSDLAKKMLTYSYAFELYYTDENGDFSSTIISPRNGYAYIDEQGKIQLFMHIFKKKFDENTYIDVYDSNNIYHCKEGFEQIEKPDHHIFGEVPAGIALLSVEFEDDTIYSDIKGLQDAYETNLSDISNEISDFRNAYLVLSGVDLKEEDATSLKEKGIIKMPTPDGKAAWLIKTINDSFIQNTLTTLEDKMYQLTSHINHNEKMQSNLSGVALRSRLISLEEKCKLNQKALSDCVKTRLRMLFTYLNYLKKLDYDYKDIKIKFTPNIPQDDLNAATIINNLGDKLSIETGLSLLSFIENPQNEIEKIKKEQSENSIGADLLRTATQGGGLNEN